MTILRSFKLALGLTVSCFLTQAAFGWTVSQRGIYVSEQYDSNPDPCASDYWGIWSGFNDGKSCTWTGSNSHGYSWRSDNWWAAGGNVPWATQTGFVFFNGGRGDQFFAIDDSGALRDVSDYISGGPFLQYNWGSIYSDNNFGAPGGCYAGAAVNVSETSATVEPGTLVVTAKKIKTRFGSMGMQGVEQYQRGHTNRYYVSPTGSVYQASDVSDAYGESNYSFTLNESGTWTYRTALSVVEENYSNGSLVSSPTKQSNDYVLGYIVVQSSAAPDARATHCISKQGSDLNRRLAGKRGSSPAGVVTGIYSEGVDIRNLLNRIDDAKPTQYRDFGNLLNTNPGALVNWSGQPVYWAATTLPDGSWGNVMELGGSPSHAFIDMASAAPGFITNGNTYSFGFWVRTTSGARTINIVTTSSGNSNATSTDSRGRDSQYIDTSWRWIETQHSYGGEDVSSPRFFITMSYGGGAVQISRPIVVKNSLSGYRARAAFGSTNADDGGPDIVFLFEPNPSL